MADGLPTTISFHMGSWLENAGLVGLYRILGDQCQIEDRQLTIPTTVLEDFSQRYFNFFSETYGRLTRFQRIISFEDQLKKWQSENFASFNEDNLKRLSDWYNKVLKYSVDSNSYKRVYDLIQSDENVVNEVKETSKLLRKLNKKQFLKKHVAESHDLLQELGSRLLKIIAYFKRSDSRKYFLAKTLIYLIIDNSWNGVSFLNPQTKKINFFDDYQEYFVTPVIYYLKADHQKDKFICRTCGRPIKRQTISYSFLRGMGYDKAKKTSNAWNFNNDQFICPLCQLLYSCVSAGFNYNTASQGIFINYNKSLQDLILANNNVLDTMLQAMNNHGTVSPFRAFTVSFEDRLNKSSTYNLADIQVVNYVNERYNFTIISPLAAKVIADAIKTSFGKKDENGNLLSVLYSAGIKKFRGVNYYSIYDDVIRRLFNSTNLYSLIYELEILLNSQSADIRYNQLHIMALININTLFFKRLSDKEDDPIMKVTQVDLSRMRGAGSHVLDYYQQHENGNKANALVYKLLQAVNTGNSEKFMAILLSVYASQHKLVPSKLVNNIDQPEVFRQYALAFIAGLIGEKK